MDLINFILKKKNYLSFLFLYNNKLLLKNLLYIIYYIIMKYIFNNFK